MSSDDRRRTIGKVVSVAADKFVVELHSHTDNFTVVGFDDMHYVARLGSFVMIPVQSEYVVAEVVGLRERDLIGARQEQDSGGLDKAGSAKFLDLVPVGMLPQKRDGAFRFGVSIFPSLYSDALYTFDEELDWIFEVAEWEELVPQPPEGDGDGTATRFRALTIGSSVVFQGYDIKVRVDDFFGGHVAVLGNTGSGKSCTVATVLQSLFEKKNSFVACGATFIVLDVNGEYRRAFAKLPKDINRLYLHLSEDPQANAREPFDEGEETAVFRLPHWFMSVEEWELLLRASERTQQPVLRTALGLTSLFSADRDGRLGDLRNHILSSCIQAILQSEVGSGAKKDRIVGVLSTFKTDELNIDAVRDKIAISFGEMADPEGLTDLLDNYFLDDASLPGYANVEFEFNDLGAALDLALLYEEAHGNRQIRDYCSQMLTRFKWISEREEFAFLRVSPSNLSEVERGRARFVERFLGLERHGEAFHKSAQIIVLDMNEAADEVVEVASAVIARLVFDRLRRADPRNRFPVNLVLEEAHRYVAEYPSRYAIDASQTFERIAKEGRKYGMFLKVASQRPSELSKTVLSQCSNFLVHRIQNPDDLSHIRQMTPFVSESVLRRLPSLPKQHALIFGNAVNLPTTFRVRDVDPRPKSDDAAIRELWFRPPEKAVELAIPSSQLTKEAVDLTATDEADADT
ncbi:DUF87 domain-containing protein [Sneathiella sp.]|uniref:ATP-binding protein n=1 Tax=Sneathiella sp. TaxID=1964365 RepID=UPI002620D0DF|nr:DUF87 domain-containing protein [Sneathiella sp.]MDF2369037.1 DUF87 domain-containing protein [Sneathiella sp.]